MGIKLWIVLSIIVLAMGKGKSSDRIKREECEKLEVCKWDRTENCTYRCMSEMCYIKVFGDKYLEMGEIHREQDRLFLECFRKEEKELKAAKYKG